MLEVSLPQLNTEQYNGSAWTEVNDLNTGRDQGGSWNLSAAHLLAGEQSWHVAKQNHWNGSSWTEVTDLNTAEKSMGAGSQTCSFMLEVYTTISANTELGMDQLDRSS